MDVPGQGLGGPGRGLQTVQQYLEREREREREIMSSETQAET